MIYKIRHKFLHFCINGFFIPFCIVIWIDIDLMEAELSSIGTHHLGCHTGAAPASHRGDLIFLRMGERDMRGAYRRSDVTRDAELMRVSREVVENAVVGVHDEYTSMLNIILNSLILNV